MFTHMANLAPGPRRSADPAKEVTGVPRERISAAGMKVFQRGQESASRRARRTVVGGAAMGTRAWTVKERVEASGKSGVGRGVRRRTDVLPSGRWGSGGREK
jgi:hypothetical protein